MSHMIRFLALVAVLQSSVVYGQSGRDEEARGLYLAGQAAFDAGRYDDALTRFEESYRLSNRPELLFNMGHSAQLDGQLARAIDAFERYLEEAPNGPNWDGLDERIESLRERVAQEAATRAPQVEEHEAEARHEAPIEVGQEARVEAPVGDGDEAQPSHTLALTLGVSGAAFVAGGGVVLGLMAGQQSLVQDAEDGRPWADVQGNHERARTFRALGISLLSAGAILAGVGLSLWLANRTQVSVSAQGVRVSGSF